MRRLLKSCATPPARRPTASNLLNLPELVFQNAPLGDVFGDHFQCFLRPLRTVHDAAVKPYRDQVSIFTLPAHFQIVQPRAAPELLCQPGLLPRFEKNIPSLALGPDTSSAVPYPSIVINAGFTSRNLPSRLER